jgi:hypothetical protein
MNPYYYLQYFYNYIFYIKHNSVLKLEIVSLVVNLLTAGINTLYLLCSILILGQEEFKVLILSSW